MFDIKGPYRKSAEPSRFDALLEFFALIGAMVSAIAALISWFG